MLRPSTGPDEDEAVVCFPSRRAVHRLPAGTGEVELLDFELFFQLELMTYPRAKKIHSELSASFLNPAKS
jgi:hypothetical protein